MNSLVVIGIGHDGPQGLTKEAQEHIAAASVLAGGRRQLHFYSDWNKDKIELNGDVGAFVDAVSQRYHAEMIVVLASGDPLFYGIGRALLQAVPKEELLVIPSISSVQLAFARIKEAWDDACVVSVHGRPLETLAPSIQSGIKKLAVLTDANNNPAAVADLLRRLGAEDRYALWVCENLGGADERVGRYSATALRKETFSPLNVVILLRENEPEHFQTLDAPLLGIPEEMISHRPGPHGMITQREVRVLTLCHLELRAGNVLWDIGAGSGSVSLEAGRLGGGLRVFAVERDAESFERLKVNLSRLAPGNVTAIQGEAPDCLSQLPDPDAVFIGGSGGHLSTILDVAMERLRTKGRLVLNCITLETMMLSWQRLEQRGWAPEVTSIQLAHSRRLGSLHNLHPENPIFIVRGRKP